MTDRNVTLPEGGKGAHLAFDVAAMEALHQRYGDHYINDILAGLDRHNISTFTAVLDVMARETKKTAAEIIDASTMSELAIKIADAISLRIHGRTFKEQGQNIAAAINEARAAPDTDAA